MLKLRNIQHLIGNRSSNAQVKQTMTKQAQVGAGQTHSSYRTKFENVILIGNRPAHFIRTSDLNHHRIHRPNRYTQADVLSSRIVSQAATDSGIQTANDFYFTQNSRKTQCRHVKQIQGLFQGDILPFVKSKCGTVTPQSIDRIF